MKPMRFVDTLLFIRADSNDGAIVSTPWQARNQRRNSDMERSDQESQKVMIFSLDVGCPGS